MYAAPGGENPAIQDLWYNDSNGTTIQLTKAGIVNATIASLEGESYSTGTFTWTQAQDALPTTPANFDIGSVTIRPNTAGTTNGVLIQPPGSLAALVSMVLSPFNLTLPAAAPAFTNLLTISSAGVIGNGISLGTVGQILTSNGASSSPSFQTAITVYTAVTGNYAALFSDNVINVSGASATITLPTAVGITGKEYTIIHNGTSLTQAYTIATTSAQTINGVASGSYILYTTGEILSVISDGANWQIIDHQAVTNWATDGINTFTATSAYVFTWVGNQSIVVGDTYSDGLGHTYTVSVTSNTTTGTFSGTANPAATGTLTRVTGTGVTPINWTSRTTTGQPVKGSTQSVNEVWWRRVGSELIVRAAFRQTNAGGSVAGLGDYLFFVPAGLVVDTTKLTAELQIGGPFEFKNMVGTALLIHLQLELDA